MHSVSIRRALAAVTALLLLTTLLAAVGLIFVTAHSRRLADVQAAAVESVRAVEEIEIALLLAQRGDRFRQLPDAVPDPHWPELDHWLAIAKRHSSTPEEDQLVLELEAEVALVRQQWSKDAEVAHGRPRAADQALARTLPTVERLLALNLAQAAEAHAMAKRWSHRVEMGGLLLAAALLSVVALGMASVRALLYRPVEELRATNQRFGAGDTTSRVPLEGRPQEIWEVGRTFNDMADALARQREMQLALVASVAHDLRNPLFALQLAAGAALRARDGSERERRLADQVVVQLRRVTRMLEDLVEASRIEAGHLEIRTGSVDLVLLAGECAELFQTTSARHEVVLVAPPPELIAEVDATRISQVLNNLVSNAIKYSPGGGRVEVALAAGDDEVTIRVTDQGVGIPADQHAQVFEPFRRVGTIGEAAGAGLGLSVCKRIVEAHGGTIAVSSAPGAGTTLQVRLPQPRRGDRDDVPTPPRRDHEGTETAR